MEFQYLQFECKNKIGILTFNRPKNLNALNSSVLNELEQFLEELKILKMRCLILTGAGKSFIAGADIKEMCHFTTSEAYAFSKKGQELLSSIEKLPFPVIAAINGFALGGGLELALACDFLLISDQAKLGLPEVNLGLIPAFGGTQRLPLAVGSYKAKEMIYSGKIYSAQEACSMGLGNKVILEATLLEEALKLAEEIANSSPLGVSKSKKLIRKNFCLKKGLKRERKTFAKLFKSHDAKVGMQAFLEKRPAVFEDI